MTEPGGHESACRFSATRGIGSPEKPLRELVSRHIQVRRHVTEDASQRTDAQRVVRGDRHVVLAALAGGEPHVAAGLPRDALADGLCERPVMHCHRVGKESIVRPA